jgi:soluble lytic murein transglycosylase
MLTRPYLNLKFAAWYLDRLLDQADGDVMAALAGYNGGPSLAAGWHASTPDPDLFVEIISKSETQTYLRSIYRQYTQYRRLYGEQGIGD